MFSKDVQAAVDKANEEVRKMTKRQLAAGEERYSNFDPPGGLDARKGTKSKQEKKG